MTHLERLIIGLAGLVLGATLTTSTINFKEYVETKNELMIKTWKDPSVINREISDSVIGEKIARDYLINSNCTNFDLFSIGKCYAIKEYFEDCYRFNHSLQNGQVGVL